MTIANFFMLLGGLALFLYGMQMMSKGLETAAGNRMKRILERLTSNRFLGVLVGAGITIAIQSSSATTVMAVGFVNSGLMALEQAVWIIMGANIGTTVTAQLIALDIGLIAPLFAIVGVVMVVFFKKQKLNHIGQIIAGLGVLFIGMGLMSDSMSGLRDAPFFVDLIAKFQNPITGILIGAGFTAIIQSSAAAIGILQALAIGGTAFGVDSAVYVLFGTNIGTCITAVLASFGTSRAAKRTTIVHLAFNVIGTVIFTFICYFTPFTSAVATLTPTNVAAQIANVHTIFNVVTTIVLLPFGKKLAQLATRILPERPEEQSGMRLHYLGQATGVKEGGIGHVSIVISQLQQETRRMFALAQENVQRSFDMLETLDMSQMPQVEEAEEYLDYLNKEISAHIAPIMAMDVPTEDSEVLNAYFKMTADIERIGDHAMNLAEHAQMLHRKELTLSPLAMAEVAEMKRLSLENLELVDIRQPAGLNMLALAEAAEAHVDDVNEQFRENQIDRMKKGICSGEACVIYSEILTDFERIGDHMMNLAEEFQKVEYRRVAIDLAAKG